MSMVSQDQVQILYIFPMDKTKREGKPSHFPRVLWDRQLMEFCIPFLQSLLTSSRKCVPNRLSAREKSQREETLPLMKGTRVRELPRWLNGKNKQTKTACQCRRHRRRKFSPLLGKILWRRKWQPTPVFLPGKSHGQRSLVGPWGCKRVRHD